MPGRDAQARWTVYATLHSLVIEFLIPRPARLRRILALDVFRCLSELERLHLGPFNYTLERVGGPQDFLRLSNSFASIMSSLALVAPRLRVLDIQHAPGGVACVSARPLAI